MQTLEHIKCCTPDFAKENVAKLLALFPECAGERDEVDFDKLRQTLSSSVIEGNVERYEFTWPGKRAAKAAASAPHNRGKVFTRSPFSGVRKMERVMGVGPT